MVIKFRHHAIAFIGCLLGLFAVSLYTSFEFMQQGEIDNKKYLAFMGTVIGSYLGGILTSWRLNRMLEKENNELSPKSKQRTIFIYMASAYTIPLTIFCVLAFRFLNTVG